MRFDIPAKLRHSWIGIKCDVCGKRYAIRKDIVRGRLEDKYWACKKCASFDYSPWETVAVVVLAIITITTYVLILSLL